MSDLGQAEKTDRVVTEGLRCGMDGILCLVLNGQMNALSCWWLTTESEPNLVTDLGESELWRYLRLSLKREQCPFVTW